MPEITVRMRDGGTTSAAVEISAMTLTVGMKTETNATKVGEKSPNKTGAMVTGANTNTKIETFDILNIAQASVVSLRTVAPIDTKVLAVEVSPITLKPLTEITTDIQPTKDIEFTRDSEAMRAVATTQRPIAVVSNSADMSVLLTMKASTTADPPRTTDTRAITVMKVTADMMGIGAMKDTLVTKDIEVGTLLTMANSATENTHPIGGMHATSVIKDIAVTKDTGAMKDVADIASPTTVVSTNEVTHLIGDMQDVTATKVIGAT